MVTKIASTFALALLCSFSIQAMDTKHTFVNTLLECYINTTPHKSVADVGGYFTNIGCNKASLNSDRMISLPTSWYSRHDNIIKISQKGADRRFIDVDQIPYAQLGVNSLYSVKRMNDDTDIVFFSDTRRIIAYNVATKQKLFDIAVEQPAHTLEILKVETDGHTFRYQFKNYFPEVNLDILSEEQKRERARRFSSKISVSFPCNIETLITQIETFITQPLSNHDSECMQAIMNAVRQNRSITLDQNGLAFYNQLPQEIKTLIATTGLINNIRTAIVVPAVQEERNCSIQ